MFDHIVLVSLDTLRSDLIRTNPRKLWPEKYKVPFEPNTDILDRLVANGTTFFNCISAAPYTSASHASFFTGQWPLQHGVFEFFNRKLTSPTVFTLAKRAGLPTIFKVDFPVVLGPLLGFDRDIDHYIIEDDDAFLEALSSFKRSFSFVHFGGLHPPYGFHNLRYGGPHYPRKVEELEAEIPRYMKLPTDQVVETYREGSDLDLMLRYKRIIEYHYGQKHYDKLFSLYLEGADFFIKNRFEPFFHRLEMFLRDKRHLLVLFSDHGHDYDEESCGHFNSVSEGVLRVPVIFCGSGIPARTHATPIRSIDVAPTLVDLAGFDRGRQRAMHGVSLAAAILHGQPYPTRPAVAQAYTSDIYELIKFQHRVLATGKKTGALRHVCYKETVYEEPFRLLRQNHVYTEHGSGIQSCPPKITSERRGADGREWRPFANIDVESRLLGVLDAYNQGRKGGKKLRAIPDQIRQQLSLMGYNV